MKTLTFPAPSLSSFFDTYAAALEHYDTKAMSYLYYIPCTLASDETATVFNDVTKLEGFFNVGAGFYRQFGIANIRHELWGRRQWTERIVNVKVNWQYLDAFNILLYKSDYQYVLKLDKNGQWKILLSVAINERQNMEDWKRRNAATHL